MQFWSVKKFKGMCTVAPTYDYCKAAPAGRCSRTILLFPLEKTAGVDWQGRNTTIEIHFKSKLYSSCAQAARMLQAANMPTVAMITSSIVLHGARSHISEHSAHLLSR
mmetsp:Transcript_6560/g.17582  ORF Transcript_6560/g.17582 Transcript_6560/m.17582 type:complete len:108 (-) Transcript_6560:2960-3283(-)|eukprot:1158495-Pelagomonas_calceolata.AAC.3